MKEKILNVVNWIGSDPELFGVINSGSGMISKVGYGMISKVGSGSGIFTVPNKTNVLNYCVIKYFNEDPISVSVSDLDPDWIWIQSGQWIRIRNRNPDLGGQKWRPKNRYLKF
jgi:hypothetical protein